MGFLEKATTFVTGKNSIERRQEAEANKIIRREAIQAQLQQRRESAIQLAKDKEKLIYERRTKALRNPKPMFSGYGSPFGERANFGQSTRPQRVKVKKSKKGKSKVITRYIDRPSQPQRLDIIGGGFARGNYRVI